LIRESSVDERSETISYERLYRLWEENAWSAVNIDFTSDREDWRDKLTPLQRKAAVWNYALFLVGEEAVARTLTPVLDATPGYAAKIFLSTQIVDEARHHVFFDRFMREVADLGTDTASTLASVQDGLTWGFRQTFAELDRITEALRKKPKDMPLLAQAVSIYHIVIEGMLAIPGQHFIQRYTEKYEILPGFTAGMTNVSRDEARHVAFGVKLLGELIVSSKDCRSAALETFEKVLPWTAGVFVPPNLDRRYSECFGFTVEDIFSFGQRSLDTKLKRIGIAPSEIPMLARWEDESYDERAARLWALVRDGVLGDDRREPRMTRETMEIVFDGIANSIDLEAARSLGGPILWDFSDEEAWHLTVVNGHAEAKPGRINEPALTLECSAGDWAKVAVGRLDPRWALLSRKLRVHGHLSSRAKLARLFN
jgi:ribonucleotide reductase beta subunit family protein with ferritin-like domain/putative sterol carrier protein